MTLWHLAGTLDALGNPAGALRLYSWLLESKKTPDDYPCWESAAWSDALKTDCLFRMGLCFERLGRKPRAESCFRKYIDLLVAGANGSYPMDDVVTHIRALGASRADTVGDKLREAADSILRASGNGAATKPPRLDRKKLHQLQHA